VLSSLGEHDAARELLEQTLPLVRRRLGAEHPDTLVVMHNLAGALHHLKRYTEARGLAEQALAAYRRVRGDDHLATLTATRTMASVLAGLEQYGDAAKMLDRVLAARRRQLGDGHPDTLTVMHDLADVHIRDGKDAAAKSLAEQTVALRRQVLGAEHPDTKETEMLLEAAKQGPAVRAIMDLMRRAGLWSTGHSLVFASNSLTEPTPATRTRVAMTLGFRNRHGQESGNPRAFGYGGIAYRHVSNTNLALFSHFIPCGVWEAVYIIEGLLKSTFDIQPTSSMPIPKASRCRTSASVPAGLWPAAPHPKLARPGLLPPDEQTRYQHIDTLLGDEAVVMVTPLPQRRRSGRHWMESPADTSSQNGPG
jgi:Tetratricopeptide repeat/Tn3 transposase DDE domain